MAVITGSSSAVVDAPIGECWAVVEDVPSAPEWQNGLVQMDVIERDEQGRALVCDAVSDAKLRKVHTRVRFTYEQPTRLSWSMIEGELDSLEGSWELEDIGGGRTNVTYALAVDPGPVGALVRGPIERVARSMLVNGRAKELGKRVSAENRQ
jgi:ribosome-associated toxin RatA of RatAB toxin-antitoxin module